MGVFISAGRDTGINSFVVLFPHGKLHVRAHGEHRSNNSEKVNQISLAVS